MVFPFTSQHLTMFYFINMINLQLSQFFLCEGGRHRWNEPDLTRPMQGMMLGDEEGEDLPPAFVEFAALPPEVKRATVVGNPMFSAEREEDRKDDVLALEDLNLGMDYQQIMEYFDNLKESNA